MGGAATKQCNDRMNIRYLRTFVAVAEQGNFARAANAVCLTQSAVSVQMRTIENQLGVELFDRSKRPAVLNSNGEALLLRVRELVSMYDSLTDDPMGTVELPGVVQLGAVRSSLSGLIPRTVTALHNELSGVRLTVSGGLPAELITRVESGELDGALVSEPQYLPPQLVWTPLMEEPMIVIAPIGTGGVDCGELLTSWPYVGLNRGVWGGRLIEEYLHARGIILRPILEFDSLEPVILTVQRGLGVSIVHQGCIDHPLRHMLHRVPFDAPELTRRLGLLYRPTGQRVMVMKALARKLECMASELSDIWLPLSEQPTEHVAAAE
jgi:DNA-binding transcriptional LysR family regulator